MKNTFRVEWTRTAYNDLAGIIAYISLDSRANAKMVLSKIKEKTANLHHDPIRGRLIPELRDQGLTQYRELVVAPWRLMYRISADTIYVVSVIDSRRNVEDILLDRFSV